MSVTIPRTHRLRLHRETVRRLGASPQCRSATDQPQTGDTAFCGPSRLSLCDGGCETARA